MALGGLWDAGISEAYNQLSQRQLANTGSTISGNISNYAVPMSLPEGWGFSYTHANAIPLTFIAKLRHEIKEWHGDVLGKN